MKRLLAIVALGMLVFMGGAVVQEWRVFFPERASSAAELISAPQADKEVAQAVTQFVTLVSHFYQSGGDARFAERIPASNRVTAELLADADYLRRNGRTQKMQLMRMDMLEVSRLSPQRAIVRTLEYWVIHSVLTADPRKADPVRSQKLFVEYRMIREGVGWKVDSWELVDAPEGLEAPRGKAKAEAPR